MQGFVVGFGDVMQKGAVGFIEETTKLVLEGKIKNRETKYYGIKESDKALADLHHGQVLGKPVVIVTDD